MGKSVFLAIFFAILTTSVACASIDLPEEKIALVGVRIRNGYEVMTGQNLGSLMKGKCRLSTSVLAECEFEYFKVVGSRLVGASVLASVSYFDDLLGEEVYSMKLIRR